MGETDCRRGPNDFGLVFKLRGLGWARLVMYSMNEVADLHISYLADAPRHILEAILLVTDPAADQAHAVVAFANEPGDHWLRLRRQAEKVEITVYYAEDDRNLRIEELEVLITAHGSKFHASVPYWSLAWHVHKEFEELLRTLGKEGYKAAWMKYEFPEHAFVELQTRVFRWNEEGVYWKGPTQKLSIDGTPSPN